MTVHLGLDLSPTHFALVGVDENEHFVGGFMATTAKTAKKLTRSVVHTSVVKPLPKFASLLAKLSRLEGLKFTLVRALQEVAGDTAGVPLSLEDYAYASANQAHQIGETAGLCRLAILNAGMRLRLYTPNSIKFYATGNGAATKQMICAAMLERGAHVLGGDQSFAEEVDEHGDFYDAYALALMTLDEVRLRAGTLKLEDLSDSRRKAFTKTDKAGNNVLVTPWACWEEGAGQ